MTALYVTWAVGMLMTAGFGLVSTVWQAMAVAFVSESCITALVVIWFTLLQRLVPGHLLGRVSSLDWLISIAGVPLSFAVVGPAAALVGPAAASVTRVARYWMALMLASTSAAPSSAAYACSTGWASSSIGARSVNSTGFNSPLSASALIFSASWLLS